MKSGRNLTKKDCKIYDEFNQSINKNFYLLNAHGAETESDYEVPEGVRIIMFCYSGSILDICRRFDRFNWSNILLDPSSSSNYCSFLSAISEYSSIRDHFCIYEENDVIKNLMLFSDKEFREGLFRLPVKGFAYDKENETVVISSHTLLSEVNGDKRLKKLVEHTPRTHIKVDDKKIVDLMRKNNDVAVIKSFVRHIHDKISLSNLINSMRSKERDFTLLLMVCREGVGSEVISKGRRVIDEMEKMRKRIELEKILRS